MTLLRALSSGCLLPDAPIHSDRQARACKAKAFNRAGSVSGRPFRNFHLSSVAEGTSAEDVASYLLAVARMRDGAPVARTSLRYLLHDDRQKKRPHAPKLIAVGRSLLAEVEFDRRRRQRPLPCRIPYRACVRDRLRWYGHFPSCKTQTACAQEEEKRGPISSIMIKRYFIALAAAQPCAVVGRVLRG